MSPNKENVSMYLNHTKGYSDWDCKNLVVSPSINIPVAVPETCF